MPTAQSTVRESDSIVYAVSGQIVVIGGLMQETAGEDIAAPGAGRYSLLWCRVQADQAGLEKE